MSFQSHQFGIENAAPLCPSDRPLPGEVDGANSIKGRLFDRQWIMVIVLALLSVAMRVQFGRFPLMDETNFKAAGREWAASGKFAAPELYRSMFNLGHLGNETW